MKFLSIPENGSSWAESLIYELDTESSSPQNITVDIIDDVSHESLGVCHIYGVVSARVDIAPYVRAACSIGLEQSTTHRLTISSAARRIRVVANGTISDSRLFFRAAIDSTKAQMLSVMPDRQSIVLGDVIRFTAYAATKVELKLVVKTSLTTKQVQLTCMSSGMPVEAVVATGALPQTTSRLTIYVYCDGELVGSHICDVVRRDATARMLAWFNHLGGVEYYTFPRSTRTSYEAVVESVAYGDRSSARLKRGRVYRDLISGCEHCEEMERIAAMLFSPTVYECRGGEVEEVELTSRVQRFDRHNRLPQIVVEVAEKWKGGELC